MSIGLLTTGNYPNFGQFNFPGIQSYDSFQFTDVSGISPARGTLEMFPEYGFPQQDGDITLTYNDNAITIRDAHIESAQLKRGSGGKTMVVTFLDERWKWKFASITGHYNIRFPNNFVDPEHEKTAEELVSMCFDALGVDLYDVSALPNDARPEVAWDHANPAQEMARICDDLGCRIVPQRSTGAWVVCVTGVGDSLPETYPYNDGGDGIDPKPIPDFIKIVSAPIRYQMAVRLAPVALDSVVNTGTGRGVVVNNAIASAPALVDLGVCSYRPNKAQNAPSPYGFLPFQGHVNISPIRFQMPDGTLKSNQELAQQSVFRCFRIYDPAPMGQFTSTGPGQAPQANKASIVIPGYSQPITKSGRSTGSSKKVFRKQMILSNELVTSYPDAYEELHKRPAFVFGQFRGNKIPDASSANYPFGTRIDWQTRDSDKTSQEEQRSFSLNVHPIDTDRTTVTLSDEMVYLPISKADAAALKNRQPVNLLAYDFDAARLWLMCAVQIRDLDTWQPVRNEYYYQVGDGDDQDFCLEVVKNDIQPWYITTYPLTPDVFRYGQDLTLGTTTNNADEVERQSLYYAQQIAQTLQIFQTETRTYLGLFPIDMDGAIQQITYRIGPRGSETVASLNTEHDFDIPPYAERRQRDGRHGPQSRADLLMELIQQRTAMAVGGISTGRGLFD